MPVVHIINIDMKKWIKFKYMKLVGVICPKSTVETPDQYVKFV